MFTEITVPWIGLGVFDCVHVCVWESVEHVVVLSSGKRKVQCAVRDLVPTKCT